MSSRSGLSLLLIAHNWQYRDLRPFNVGLHLSDLGYHVHLLLPSRQLTVGYQVEQVNERFTLYKCPTILPGVFKKGSDPLDLLTKLYLVRRLSYDLVIGFDARPTVILPAVHAKSARDVPLILDWTDWFGRGGIINERSGSLYRTFFERVETFFEEHYRLDADSAMVICPALAGRLRSLGYEGAILDFPLGCDTIPLEAAPAAELRRRLRLPLDSPLLACVGTLLPADARLLFESVKAVQSSTGARLVLIGDGKFDESALPAGTVRTGRLERNELYQHLRSCDVCLLPLKNNIANNGRWPSKLNDYLEAGCPVVATPTAVVRDLMSVAQFGAMADDNPAAFASAIERLLANPDQLREFGASARRLAVENLSWPPLIARLDAFITATLAAAA